MLLVLRAGQTSLLDIGVGEASLDGYFACVHCGRCQDFDLGGWLALFYRWGNIGLLKRSEIDDMNPYDKDDSNE